MSFDLHAVAEAINNTPGYFAYVEDGLELGDDYALRWGRENDDCDELVLMGDLGVTWEPSKPWPTPRYCVITAQDTPTVVRQLLRLADAYADGELSGEDSGEQFLD